MPHLGREPHFHPNVTVRNCRFGSFVEIGEGSTVSDRCQLNSAVVRRVARHRVGSIADHVDQHLFDRNTVDEHLRQRLGKVQFDRYAAPHEIGAHELQHALDQFVERHRHNAKAHGRNRFFSYEMQMDTLEQRQGLRGGGTGR